MRRLANCIDESLTRGYGEGNNPSAMSQERSGPLETFVRRLLDRQL